MLVVLLCCKYSSLLSCMVPCSHLIQQFMCLQTFNLGLYCVHNCASNQPFVNSDIQDEGVPLILRDNVLINRSFGLKRLQYDMFDTRQRRKEVCAYWPRFMS